MGCGFVPCHGVAIPTSPQALSQEMPRSSGREPRGPEYPPAVGTCPGEVPTDTGTHMELLRPSGLRAVTSTPFPRL